MATSRPWPTLLDLPEARVERAAGTGRQRAEARQASRAAPRPRNGRTDAYWSPHESRWGANTRAAGVGHPTHPLGGRGGPGLHGACQAHDGRERAPVYTTVMTRARSTAPEGARKAPPRQTWVCLHSRPDGCRTRLTPRARGPSMISSGSSVRRLWCNSPSDWTGSTPKHARSWSAWLLEGLERPKGECLEGGPRRLDGGGHGLRRRGVRSRRGPAAAGRDCGRWIVWPCEGSTWLTRPRLPIAWSAPSRE